LAFPRIGPRRDTGSNDLQRIAELERKIGQLTMKCLLLKKPCLYPPAVVNSDAASPQR
jgi:hypothetical protein